MSIFSWLLPKSKPMPDRSAGLRANGATAVVPPRGHATPTADPLATLKQQRQERREQLYGVVRAAMLRSAVLAANYKFKVLSLDARGCQFLIMVDMADDMPVVAERLASIENLIATEAAHRQLLVKAVYWRINQPPLVAAHHATTAHLAAGVPPAMATVATTPPDLGPSITPDVAASFAAQPVAPPIAGFEPIAQDEVLAFKKAIASAPGRVDAPKPGQVTTSGPFHHGSSTGFEDTQVIEHDDVASPLSGTQFGGLG